MAVGAILPPLFFERRRSSIFAAVMAFSERRPDNPSRRSGRLPRPVARLQIAARDRCRRILSMANTTSAKKATRKIARRTIVNKSRRTQMRGAVRTVEEAIKKGDRDAALKAMEHAEPQLMRAAQSNIIHKNNASRKVSRLSHQIAKLAKSN
jgi:small subunit ribosomal protein S20